MRFCGYRLNAHRHDHVCILDGVSKPTHEGRTALTLPPLEPSERLAALIPRRGSSSVAIMQRISNLTESGDT